MTKKIISQILMTTMAKVFKCVFACYEHLYSGCVTVKQQDKGEKFSFSVTKSRWY